MGNPVVHFEIVGKDSPGLQSFYEGAFDWQIGPPVPSAGISYALVDPHGEGGINGGIGAGMDGYAGHATFYVQVPELEAALANISSLGGTTMMPPDQVPGGPADRAIQRSRRPRRGPRAERP